MNNCQNLQPPEIPDQLDLIQSVTEEIGIVGDPQGPIKTDITRITSTHKWDQFKGMNADQLRQLLQQLVEDYEVTLISIINQVNFQANTLNQKFQVDDVNYQTRYRTQLFQDEITNLLDYINYNNAMNQIADELQNQVDEKIIQTQKLSQLIEQLKSKCKQ